MPCIWTKGGGLRFRNSRKPERQRKTNTSAKRRTFLTLWSPGGATSTTARRLGDGGNTIRVL